MKTFLLVLISLNLLVIHSVIVTSVDENIHDRILSNFLNAPKKELFKVYHFLYKKEYDINTKEGLFRYKTFKENLKLIEETNAQNLSFKLGIGPFTDISRDEFRDTYLGKPRTKAIEMPNSTEFNPSFLKGYTPGSLSIDYKSHFRAPVNQGSCGSCWAFGTVATIEGNYSLKFGKKLQFSHQQLVDCDTGNGGCNGGYENRAMDYIKANGIAYESVYPYTSGNTRVKGTCKAASLTKNFVVDGYETCFYGRCGRDKFIALLQKGPVSVGIDGEGNGLFSNYKSGIIDMPCSNLNHAVNVVGIGNDPTVGDYYIGRNSWGTWWGEEGYFRIKLRDSDQTCYIENEAFLSLVRDADTPIPPPPPPQCAKIYPSCDFAGTPVEVCENKAFFDSTFNSAGYSIGKFKSIRYFNSNFCRGSSYNDIEDERCMNSVGLGRYTNNIKSVIVTEDKVEPSSGCLWLYDEPCFTGQRFEICSSVEDLGTINFANKVSSVRMGKGVNSFTLYSNVKFEGNYATRNVDYFALVTWIDNDVESIKITLA